MTTYLRFNLFPMQCIIESSTINPAKLPTITAIKVVIGEINFYSAKHLFEK